MLWCYERDLGLWGNAIAARAQRRGMDAAVFMGLDPAIKAQDYVFMRVPQWEPECTEAKGIVRELQSRGCILIPDFFTCMSYEDKVLQARAYFDWMPKTFILQEGDSLQQATRAMEALGFPFVSKARTGSASANVRLINSAEEGYAEFRAAMTKGIPIKTGKGRMGKQQGYVLWQRFCADNDCDYRAVITGRHVMMLRRYNKPGTPFASGSGKHEPVVDVSTIGVQRALGTARKFFEEFRLKWCGIDLVFDAVYDEWKVLETTLGWKQSAYLECPYFGTDYFGKDMYDLFLDELEAGVFG